MDISNVLQYVQEANIKCVAFDIFDTLIKRCVHPEYVKKIWAKQVSTKLKLSLSGEKLYELRNRAEADLCKENNKNGYDLEFQYSDLIENLYKSIETDIPKDRFFSTCIETELDTECRVQSLYEDTKRALVDLHDAGVRCICVSDFYLSAENIKKLLSHHGIDNYFAHIYVSSDYLITKRSSRLYEEVICEENRSPSDFLMIGDNKYSDVENAREKGMNALWLDRTQMHEEYSRLWKEENDPNRVNAAITACKQPRQESYFGNLTFSLYAFTQLLHEQLMHDGCKNVFFLSREGEFLKTLFDLYQEENHFVGSEKINTHYLIVSRKATFLPSLKTLEEEDFFVLFRQYRAISLFDFLSSLNFEGDIITRIAEQLNADPMERLPDLPTSELFARLKALPYFKDTYETKRTEQYTNFIEYLKQFGVDYKNEGLSIVDVGWKGSIQDNLFNILGGETVVNGYYLGLVATGNLSEKNRKIGLLFQNCNNRITSNFPVFDTNRSIFEMILAASHGSANGYFRTDNGIKPETYYDAEEEKLYHTVIKGIQEDLLTSFAQLTKLWSYSTVEYEDYMVSMTNIHANMMLLPTRKETDFFRNMYHYENFGVFEYTRFEHRKTSSIQGMKNFVKFLRSPSEILSRGFWAPLTLEDAGLSFLKWPYAQYKMYRFRELLNKGKDE